MLAGILRFEWRYHTHQLTFAAAAAALALLALTLIGTGYGPDGVDINSPYTVMQSLGLLSLSSVFVVTIFCANAALRDVEHGMTEIVFATPVGKPRYLFGRFGGAMLAATTVMAIAALVLMLAPLIMAVEPERLGPVRPLAYAWALVLIVIPSVVLSGALVFAVATLTRSTLATYVSAIAIFALYMVTAMLVDSPLMAGAASPTPERLARAAVLDPFGLSAFFDQTRYWTPAERDVRHVALAGRMLVNRVLWLAAAAGVLALVYSRFAFRVDSTTRVPKTRAAAEPLPVPVPAYRPVIPASAGTRPLLAALRSTTRFELRHVLRGWTFLALLVLWAFVVSMEGVAQLGGGEYGTRVLATSGVLMDTIRLPLLIFGTIVIVYYAAEVAWRERIVGFDALADASPASSAVFYISKAAALCALPVVMALVAIVVAVVIQMMSGEFGIDLGLYATLIWFAGVPLALFAIAALALQTVSPNRWVGMLLGVALAVVARQGQSMGLEHPMLRFGAAPSAAHSEMSGFGSAVPSFAAFMLYWAAAAALLGCVSWGLWRRGIDAGVLSRFAALQRSWGSTGKRVALACALLFAGVGGALFRQTNAVHAWETSRANAAWKADYELRYRRLDGRAQPGVVAVRTTVDLFPESRRAAIAGTLTLENRTTVPVDTVWVVMRRDVRVDSLTIGGIAANRHDARFGVHVFALAKPLAPGGRSTLRFGATIDRSGVRADAPDHDVSSNGSYLTSLDAFPSLGYRASYELTDPVARHEHGLTEAASALAPLPATDSARTALAATGPELSWLTFDATVSTSIDQTALAPGRLVRAWEQDGRRYFRYVVDRPMTPRFAFASARYTVERVDHNGVTVEVWYHPAHASNVERTLDAATRSLEVLGARYGAYPHSVLRIAEVPSWWGFGAFALPTLILFTEDRGFLTDPRREDVDLVTRRVAHEVAHQWWGHTVDPADVVGASTIVETLAKHSEQLVMMAIHGERSLPPLLAFDEDRYLAGRASDGDSEPPLLETNGQAYLYYGKGAVVMHALRDLLGASAVDRALARLVSARGGPTGAATSLDLLDAMLAETQSGADSALVREWLADRVVYDFRVDTAAAELVDDGRFRVTARISVSKSAVRDRAEEARSADGEMVEVAVVDGDPSTGRILYAAKHRIAGGGIDFVTDVPARPVFVVVDPSVRRIDRDRTNNRKRLR